MVQLKQFGLGLASADREDDSAFAFETRYICALYERHFVSPLGSRLWKIDVECVPAVVRPGIRCALGIAMTQARFDYSAYLAASGVARAAMALDALHEGCLGVARSEGWSEAPFDDAYRRVVADEYRNEATSPPLRGPDKAHVAVVHSIHDADRYRAWLIVYGRHGEEIARTQVIDELPDELIFARRLGRAKWKGPSRVVFVSRGDEVLGAIDIHR